MERAGSAPPRVQIGRRDLMRGALHSEIASILVQTRPERMEAALAAVAGLPGAEIFHQDVRGKFVVVVEAADVGAIGETLNAIALLPDVLNASLVYHVTDTGPDGLA